jgi:hypothetical protein
MEVCYILFALRMVLQWSALNLGGFYGKVLYDQANKQKVSLLGVFLILVPYQYLPLLLTRSI